MSNLPEALTKVPLSTLAIPGKFFSLVKLASCIIYFPSCHSFHANDDQDFSLRSLREFVAVNFCYG